MKKTTLFALWGGLYALCAALGFIHEPAGFLKFVLVCLALGFFVPPALLLHRAHRTRDRHCASLIRNLAAASLVGTCALLVANFLSLMGSAALGDALYGALVIVSAPMACGQYWVMSMFCWACLLFTGRHILKNMKTRT